MSKYRAGDTVTFTLSESDADDLNKGRETLLIRKEQIAVDKVSSECSHPQFICHEQKIICMYCGKQPTLQEAEAISPSYPKPDRLSEAENLVGREYLPSVPDHNVERQAIRLLIRHLREGQS